MKSHPPEDLDLSRANGAGVYGYLLGGAHNVAVDRDHSGRLLAANPGQRFGAHANRAYLARVVRCCVQRGVTQFLDLGSGAPTVGDVHEIAHQHTPRGRGSPTSTSTPSPPLTSPRSSATSPRSP